MLRVPQDHATIQAAVDAAVAGDEILIASGESTEELTLRGKGKVGLRPEPGGEGEFPPGLALSDCADITLDRLRFEDLPVGIEIDAGSGLRVTRCRFAGNGTAVRATATVNAVLADNRVVGGLVGFDLTETARAWSCAAT